MCVRPHRDCVGGPGDQPRSCREASTALARLPAEPGSAPLQALLAQAAASRAALDAEHEAQVGRFARWLSGAAA